jgi:predicted DNA-binding transcriptional regulator AlpA
LLAQLALGHLLRTAPPWRATEPREVSMPSETFDSVRVVDEQTAIMLTGVSPRTWDRMRARGETPPITKISERRIGYRLIDLRAWLDARRIGAAPNAA